MSEKDEITNEQVARWLNRYEQSDPDGAWCFDHGTEQGWIMKGNRWQCWQCTAASEKHYTSSLDLCLRDVIPEIVRRGYDVDITFWVGHGCHIRLWKDDKYIHRWSVEPTDPPSIARAICEALRVVMQEEKS